MIVLVADHGGYVGLKYVQEVETRKLTAEETISYEDYEEFKSLVNEFTTENYDGLEEVQNDLQIAVGTVGDSTLRWPYDEEDEDEDW